MQFLLLWHWFCSHCHMPLAFQVPWEVTDGPGSLCFCGSGRLSPGLLQGTRSSQAEGSQHVRDCREPPFQTMLLLSEGAAVDNHFLTFLLLGCWKSHPGHLKQSTAMATEKAKASEPWHPSCLYEVSHTRPLYLKSGPHIASPHHPLIPWFFSRYQGTRHFLLSYSFPKIHAGMDKMMHFLLTCKCYSWLTSFPAAPGLRLLCPILSWEYSKV